jgi:hypothetical protein
VVHEIEQFADIFRALGFQGVPEASPVIDGVQHWTAQLDMGPNSVEGWLAARIGAELGVGSQGLLDMAAHELVIDGERRPLTRLEFGVMEYLVQREGKAVSRASLLADVWGFDYLGGSNVVDAVIRALRKKLGPYAGSIEAVSGVGYRFREQEASRTM